MKDSLARLTARDASREPGLPSAADSHGPRGRRAVAVSGSIVATTTLIIGMLAGCNPNGPQPPPAGPVKSTGTTSSDATPTPSPTPDPTRQRDNEEEAIKRAVLDYNAVLATISLDPDADINVLKTVATGELLEVSLAEYRKWRAKGWHATKAVTVENLEVDSIATEGKRKTARASYCGNATGVDVVGPAGKSQVGKNRRTQFPTIVELVETDDGTWLPWRESTDGDACD